MATQEQDRHSPRISWAWTAVPTSVSRSLGGELLLLPPGSSHNRKNVIVRVRRSHRKIERRHLGRSCRPVPVLEYVRIPQRSGRSGSECWFSNSDRQLSGMMSTAANGSNVGGEQTSAVGRRQANLPDHINCSILAAADRRLRR